MAWSAPRTWVAGEVVTAAILNTHVRDNFLQTAPGLVSAAGQSVWSTAANALTAVPVAKYKSADQTINNSTTLVNDTHLFWSVGASEVWAFRFWLYFTNASGTPGFRYALTVPASATGYFMSEAGTIGTDDTGYTYNTNIGMRTENTITTATFGTGATAFAFGWARIDGVFINSTNAGTVQFQWAQDIAVVSNTVLKKGSYVILTRLA